MRSRTIPLIRLGETLIVSIQIQLSDQLVLALKDDLGEEIATQPTRAIILEVSGVDVFDSFIAASIRDLAQVARLMGAETVVAGLDPAMAITLVEMGMSMKGVRTSLNLDAALTLLGRCRSEAVRGDAEIWRQLADTDNPADLAVAPSTTRK
jgi:rsbT antagonist protein RsbS